LVQDEIDFKSIEEAIERNLLYLIYINQSNEQFNSINLFIFNKWRANLDQTGPNYSSCTIKENKNMPLNKALELLRPDYYDYVSFLKLDYLKKHRQEVEDDNQDDFNNNSDDEQEFDDDTDENYDQNSTSDFFLDGQSKQLLDVVFRKFSSTNCLSVKDIDFLLTFLKKQKESLINRTDNEKQASTNSSTSKNQPPLPSAPGHLMDALQHNSPTNMPGTSQQQRAQFQPPLPSVPPPPPPPPNPNAYKSQPVALMSLMSVKNFNNGNANTGYGNGNPGASNQTGNFNNNNNNSNRFKGNNYNRY
jgi:hypothetical protein